MGKLIAVWGSPGSGKTTFSVKLAEALYNRSRGKSAVIKATSFCQDKRRNCFGWKKY